MTNGQAGNGGRTIARNLAYGVAGEGISGVLNFLTLILIARALGTAGFGVFSYVLAFVGVFQLLADFGISNILMREIARDRARVADIMGALLPLIWASSLGVFVLIAMIGWPLSPDRETYIATLLLGLAVLTTFHSFSFAAVCRAFEEMGYNAVGNITHKLLQIGLVLLALQQNTGVVGVSVAMLAANLYQWAFFQIIVRRRYVPHLQWRMDSSYWRYLLKEAVPIGMAMVLRRASQQTATLVLSAMASTSAVGLFNAAFKILQMVDMIPFTLSLPLFPAFSRLAVESREKLFRMLQQVLQLWLLLAAPLLVWLWVMAPQLVDLLFGAAYHEAVPTLRVLACAVPFLFITALYGYLFSAMGQQRFYTLSTGLCLLANLALCAVLIPFWGALGAGVATLVAEAAFCLAGAVLLFRLGFRMPLLRSVLAPLAVAAISALALLLPHPSSLLQAIACSLLYGALYLGLVLITGTLPAAERRQIFALLARRPSSAVKEA